MIVLIRSAQTSKFAPGDRVWYRASGTSPRQGPYIVIQGSATGKYQLVAANDIRVLVLDGKEMNESELEEATE